MGLIPDKNKPSIPRQFLEEYNILIFSNPGLGKTSFANAFNDCMLVLFENSAKAMLSNDVNLSEQVAKSPQYNYEWRMFKDLINEFMENDGHGYKTFGVDTITRAYEAAMKYIKDNELEGVHPSVLMNDDDHSGYSLLNEELKNTFGRLLNSDRGTILTAHADYKKIAELKGTKRHKLIPDTGGSFGKWVMGEVDITIFLTKNEEGQRVFQLEQQKDYNAKQRLPFVSDEIVVETDKPNPGKHMYEVFKEEFDKAIGKMNESFGVTDKMINEHYQQKEQEEKLDEYRNQIIGLCKSNGITPTKNKEMMKDEIGCESVQEINDVDTAKQYIEYLKAQ